MAEIRINATGGVKLYDADDSHYAQIIAGTITSNTDVMTLGHAAVVMGTKLDCNGNDLILDADADTYIDGGTADDTLDIYVAGAKDFTITANTLTAQSGSTIAAQALTATTVVASGIIKTDDTTAATSTTDGSLQTDGGLSVALDAIIGDDVTLITDSAVLGFGADKDTLLTHTDGTGLTLNSTNKLCFNDASQFVQGISATVLGLGATDEIDLTATAVDLNGTLDVSGTSQFNGLMTLKPGSNIHQLKLEQDNGTDYWSLHCDSSGGTLTFQRYTGGSETEKFRCLSNGTFLVGKTSADDTLEGHTFPSAGPAVHTIANDDCIIGNRQDADGSIISIKQANSQEGNIAVSGTTVAYNTFCGTHWSRLADNSKPTILRGTIIESIATMIDWYKAKFTYDGNEITEEIALPDGKSVGDSIKHTYHDVEYDAIIEKQDNEQLPMCKISDTTDSKAVYGVFMAWDNEPDDGVNDMYVAALGAFVVRINSGETVAIGDYLQSKGDGTAKVQADDILRASTIGKVTSTTKTHIHADDSYCVPCTLHCG